MKEQERDTPIGHLRRIASDKAELTDEAGRRFVIDYGEWSRIIVGPFSGPDLCREAFEGRPEVHPR